MCQPDTTCQCLSSPTPQRPHAPSHPRSKLSPKNGATANFARQDSAPAGRNRTNFTGHSDYYDGVRPEPTTCACVSPILTHTPVLVSNHHLKRLQRTTARARASGTRFNTLRATAYAEHPVLEHWMRVTCRCPCRRCRRLLLPRRLPHGTDMGRHGTTVVERAGAYGLGSGQSV